MRTSSAIRVLGLALLSTGLVAVSGVGVPAQEGEGPLRRGDSVTLDLGGGGSGRVSLPGGDAVIPEEGAVLRTLTDLDVEGGAQTSVLLESGGFTLEGRGGGPRIRVLGLEVLPGVGTATVQVDGQTAKIVHAEGGPVVLRLGSSPNAARLVLTEGGAIDLDRTGGQLVASLAPDATGGVLLAEGANWSALAPGTSLDGGTDASKPTVTAGELLGGARPPEIPTTEPMEGSEEVTARVGDGGMAAVFVADGSAARAEAGAELSARWSGGQADRQAVLATTEGTVHVSLRTGRTTAETPAHRIGAADAAGLTLTVSAEGERITVDADGAGATITNAQPHSGPSISVEVGPGDTIEWVAGDPAQGITYRVPKANGAPVTFTVGTKRIRAPAGTEITFRADGQVELLWPEGPEELFRFAFAPDTLIPAVSVPYTGLPDLLPPPPVSPSTP